MGAGANEPKDLKMNLTMLKSGRTLEVRLVIDEADMVTADLKERDMDLLRECEQSKSVSDKLLTLHTLVTGIERARFVRQQLAEAWEPKKKPTRKAKK